MEIDWIHRPTRPDGDDGTLNLCFNALDRHVVRGLADEVAVRVDRVTAARAELTFARLLEEVAAFAGVLRALGVAPGERVLSRLPWGLESLVGALATARLGAVHVGSERYDEPAAALAAHGPVVVLAEGADVLAQEALAVETTTPATIWTGEVPAGQDLEWGVLMRAGRTDPAPSAEVLATAPAFVVGERAVSLIEALADESAAWPLDAIATLVAGGTVLLALP